MEKAISLKAPRISTKYRTTKFFLGIIFDLIGMFPTLFPPLAIIWAPLSALLLAFMYKGRIGKVAGVLDFVEELVPVVDFIPTFTLTWFYVYAVKAGE